jgi:uncharacterized iron-regulated membrane protein
MRVYRLSFKKIIGQIHLWLGLSSGLLVLFLGITGCMLVFQKEIETVTNTYQYVQKQSSAFLPPSEIKKIAAARLPGRAPHSVLYGERDKAAQVIFFGEGYFYIIYIDPYTGAVRKVKNMDRDFFRIIINGHYYLWLPPEIGQPIVASATLVFLLMLISGLVLWWPKNKAARKQRFNVKWNAKWRRVNYDLHNVLGFYITWVMIFIAITGLVFGFQWFARALYWTTSGGKQQVEYYEPVSVKSGTSDTLFKAEDKIWEKMIALYPTTETIEIHFPETDSSVIIANANPDAGTYWKTDSRYFDQYTLQEIPVTHVFGQFKNTSVADKIARMNYDVHVGAIGGLPTKIIAFFASLIASSLPVTGFLIWRGRRKKKKGPAKKSIVADPREYVIL